MLNFRFCRNTASAVRGVDAALDVVGPARAVPHRQSHRSKQSGKRYVGQLDSQENRLAALRKETSDLTAQQNAAQAALDRTIMEVSVEESF